MESQEEVLDALNLFEKKPSKDIPELLERYLVQVAKTGETVFPWLRIKPLFMSKVNQVMEQFNSDVPYDHLLPYPNVEHAKYEEMKTRILEAFENFRGAPFTVQRICELVTEPRKHYKRSDKFLRGVEKNVLVVSTVDPFGRKIVSEQTRAVMNGLDMNSSSRTKTEAHPFVPVPQVDWSENNSVPSIWPAPSPDPANTPADELNSVDLKSEETVEELSLTTENSDVSVSAILDEDLPSRKPDSEPLDTCTDCVVSDSAKPFVFNNQASSIESSGSEESETTEITEGTNVELESAGTEPVDGGPCDAGEPAGELPDVAAPSVCTEETGVHTCEEETTSTQVEDVTSDTADVADTDSDESRDEPSEDSTGVGTSDHTDAAAVSDACNESDEAPCPEPHVQSEPEPTGSSDEPQASVGACTDSDQLTNSTEDNTDVCQSDILSDQSENILQQNTIQSDTVSDNDQSQQESASQSDSTTLVSEGCESVVEKSESKDESEVSDTLDSQCDTESEVKQDDECSETITSSESMDVDSHTSDKMEEVSSQSDVVTTTGLHDTEEPMEQE